MHVEWQSPVKSTDIRTPARGAAGLGDERTGPRSYPSVYPLKRIAFELEHGAGHHASVIDIDFAAGTLRTERLKNKTWMARA